MRRKPLWFLIGFCIAATLGTIVHRTIPTEAVETIPQAARKVAITIDDLPRGDDGGPKTTEAVLTMTERLLAPFRDQHIPVTGFVHAGLSGEIDSQGLQRILTLWLQAGADLGNHSYSHLNINEVPLAEYTADILKGEPPIRQALEEPSAPPGKTLTYYRHPFLRTGATSEIKQALQAFLDEHGYVVAPVTLTNIDYTWAQRYREAQNRDRVWQEYIDYMERVLAFHEQRSVDVVGREFPQILLIHASQMNAEMMPALLDMFRRRGYEFVTLDEALADPAYQLTDGYVGPGGGSWIERWAATKGMPAKSAPAAPQWVTGP